MPILKINNRTSHNGVGMHFLRIIIIFFVYICSAHAEDGEIITSSPMDTATPGDELSRLSACEKEIQNLTGRIEVLEHAIKQQPGLNANAASSVNTDTSNATSVIEEVKIDTTLANAQSDVDVEKRDYDSALAALKESRFDESEKLFLKFMEQHSQSKLISNAYFWYAESFYRRGEFEKAGVHYLKGYKQFSKSVKASDFLLKLASSLGELKKTKDACIILNKLEEEYKQRPSSSMKRGYDMRKKYGCDVKAKN